MMKKYVLSTLLSLVAVGSYLQAMEMTIPVVEPVVKEEKRRLNKEEFTTLVSLLGEDSPKEFVEDSQERFPEQFNEGMPNDLFEDLDGAALQWIVAHADPIQKNDQSQYGLRYDIDKLILTAAIEKREAVEVERIVYAASYLDIQPILDAFKGLFGNPSRITPVLCKLAFKFKYIAFCDYSQLLISLLG